MQRLKELEAMTRAWLDREGKKGDLKWESDPEGRELVVGKRGETIEEEEEEQEEGQEGEEGQGVDRKGKGRAHRRKCFNCGRRGHEVAECPDERHDERPPSFD